MKSRISTRLVNTLQPAARTFEVRDTLIVSELPRLGRNMVEVMAVLEQLVKKGCRIHAVMGGYRLDGTLSSRFLSMVLLMAAETGHELIPQRTKVGLARRKSEGKKLDRPKGTYGVSKLDQYEEEIRKLLSQGVAEAAMARMSGSSWQTVHQWVRRRVPDIDIRPF